MLSSLFQGGKAGRTNLKRLFPGSLYRVLPHIPKEGARQDRQAEFDVQDNQEHLQKAAPDAHFHELAGIGNDRGREQDRIGHPDDFFTEGHIFEDGLIGETRRVGRTTHGGQTELDRHR